LELQHLQKRSKKTPWVVKVFVSAMGAAVNQGYTAADWSEDLPTLNSILSR